MQQYLYCYMISQFSKGTFRSLCHYRKVANYPTWMNIGRGLSPWSIKPWGVHFQRTFSQRSRHSLFHTMWLLIFAGECATRLDCETDIVSKGAYMCFFNKLYIFIKKLSRDKCSFGILIKVLTRAEWAISEVVFTKTSNMKG